MSLTAEITEYTIDPFPRDTHNAHHWRMKIQRTRDGWIVFNAGYWLCPDGTWSTTTYDAERFVDAMAGISAAKEALRTLVVGVTTWDQMCAKWDAP